MQNFSGRHIPTRAAVFPGLGYCRKGSASPETKWTARSAPETLAAAGRSDVRSLVNNLTPAYYRSLADFPTFGAGWLNRTEARRDAAQADPTHRRHLRRGVVSFDVVIQGIKNSSPSLQVLP